MYPSEPVCAVNSVASGHSSSADTVRDIQVDSLRSSAPLATSSAALSALGRGSTREMGGGDLP